MSLKASLTLRYSLALAMVAIILMATHLMSVKRIASTSEDGILIDTSGMQRMLSQRIGLLSLSVLASRNSVNADLAQNLEAAVKRMADNHALLKEDWRQRAMDGDRTFANLLLANSLSSEIEAFLKEATALHQRYIGARRADRQKDNQAARMVIQAETGEFLKQLDGVVKLYTHQNTVSSSHLHTIQTYSLAFGLIILLFEVLFIFRPMVNRITACIEVLDDANEELHDLARSLSHGLKAPIVDSLNLMKLVDESLSSGKVRDAVSASGHVYASMVTMDGVIADLLEVVNRHRKAVVSFTKLGDRKD